MSDTVNDEKFDGKRFITEEALVTPDSDGIDIRTAKVISPLQSIPRSLFLKFKAGDRITVKKDSGKEENYTIFLVSNAFKSHDAYVINVQLFKDGSQELESAVLGLMTMYHTARMKVFVTFGLRFEFEDAFEVTAWTRSDPIKIYDMVEVREFKGAAGKTYSRAKIPARRKTGDAGCDAFVCFADGINSEVLEPNETKKFPLGFSLAIPHGYEVQVRPAPETKGFTAVFGTINRKATGLVEVVLTNTSKEPVLIKNGDCICQLVPAKVDQACFTNFEIGVTSEDSITE